jgi:putative ABC transport system substrate-binding protein
MRRRQFITLLGGAAAWPLVARAQQTERIRRIGILLPATADNPRFQSLVGAFLQGLALLGWTIGRNVWIDTRWATNAADIRRHAAELAALAPDVILATGATVGAMLQATRAVPIVFTIVADPVGAGFVDSLAQPGGNATGFMNFEYSLSAKWLELLKEIAPGVTRAVILRDTELASGASQFAAIQAVAPSLRMEVTPIGMRDAGEIERSLAAFARSPNGGLIVAANAPAMRMQPIEIRNAVVAAHHGLAIDRDRANPQTAGGLDDQWEAVRPVEPAAREQSHPSALTTDHEPVAVVLDLVHPIAPYRSMTRPGRDTGRDEGERKRAAGEHWPSLIVPAPGVEDRRRSGCGR